MKNVIDGILTNEVARELRFEQLDSEYLETFQKLGSFAIFGAAIANANAKGIILPDLALDNLGVFDYNNQKEVKLIDVSDEMSVQEIDLPEEKHLIPISLMSFFSSAPQHYSAAFRFGYQHAGGPRADRVLRELREDFGLNSFSDIGFINYQVNCTSSKEQPEYLQGSPDRDSWEGWRNNQEGEPIFKREPKISEFRHIIRKYGVTQSPSYKYKYQSEKHLVAVIKNLEVLLFPEPMVNIQRFYQNIECWNHAVGIARFITEFITHSWRRLPISTINQLMKINSESYGPAPNKIVDKMDKLISECDPRVYFNLFHWLWCLDDLHQGSITID